jgi:DNA-directed RNA polymerase subunit M/transcription elongation factor TFIIS
MKVNNILDKCDTEACNDINKLLKYAGITREIEQVYIPKTEEENVSDLYKCPRCSTKKCTFKEVMLRAIDEPLAVKCVCQNCGLRFQPDD